MTATKKGEGIFPIVTVKVNIITSLQFLAPRWWIGPDIITYREVIDSEAGGSYASVKQMNLLKLKPVDVQTKRVDMLMNTHVERLETYKTVIESLSGDYKMNVNFNQGEQGGTNSG